MKKMPFDDLFLQTSRKPIDGASGVIVQK